MSACACLQVAKVARYPGAHIATCFFFPALATNFSWLELSCERGAKSRCKETNRKESFVFVSKPEQLRNTHSHIAMPSLVCWPDARVKGTKIGKFTPSARVCVCVAILPLVH